MPCITWGIKEKHNHNHHHFIYNISQKNGAEPRKKTEYLNNPSRDKKKNKNRQEQLGDELLGYYIT